MSKTTTKRVIAIHQPNFIPWPGYYHKISQADVFVFLDTVEFTKGGFINRNKIKFSNGSANWLTVPVQVSKSTRQKINETALNQHQNWKDKHLKTLQSNYGKAPFFKNYFPQFEMLYRENFDTISQFNIALSKFILDVLDIRSKIIIASEMEIDHRLTRNDLLIEICKTLSADVYLSGSGAQKYNDEALFNKNDIELVYQTFTPPVYPQQHGDFISHLSTVDLLFNLGPESKQFFLPIMG